MMGRAGEDEAGDWDKPRWLYGNLFQSPDDLIAGKKAAFFS
jgi:hypothetical protein